MSMRLMQRSLREASPQLPTVRYQRHMSSEAIPTGRWDKVTNKSVRCAVMNTRASLLEPSERQEATSPWQGPSLC